MGPDLLEGIGCGERERELAADCFELVGELELVGLINFTHQILRSIIEEVIQYSMSFSNRSLSPAQIQYLRIGPKAGSSEQSRKLLSEAIRQEKNKELAGDISANSSLNKIPKLTYGQFEKTVSNFGVLINKNFGNETAVHQAQKFGSMAAGINKIMLQEKDKPIYNEKKNALLKKIKDRSDNRNFIKTVYDFNGHKLNVTLKSFSVDSDRSAEGGLPMPYLRFLINHVNSARLVKIIEPAMRSQGNQIVVEFDRIESRAGHLANSEAKYQSMDYNFERLGQEFSINLPHLEFEHPASKWTQRVYILNKEILDTLDCNFDNVDTLAEKYLESQSLEAAIAQLSQLEEEPEAEEEEEPKDE